MSFKAASLQPQGWSSAKASAAARQPSSAWLDACSVSRAVGLESPVTGQEAAGSPIASARGHGRARNSLPGWLKDKNGISTTLTRALPGLEATLEDDSRAAPRAAPVTSRSSLTEKVMPDGVIIRAGIASRASSAVPPGAAQADSTMTAPTTSKLPQGVLRCGPSTVWIVVEASRHVRCEEHITDANVRRAERSYDCGE